MRAGLWMAMAALINGEVQSSEGAYNPQLSTWHQNHSVVVEDGMTLVCFGLMEAYLNIDEDIAVFYMPQDVYYAQQLIDVAPANLYSYPIDDTHYQADQNFMLKTQEKYRFIIWLFQQNKSNATYENLLNDPDRCLDLFFQDVKKGVVETKEHRHFLKQVILELQQTIALKQSQLNNAQIGCKQILKQYQHVYQSDYIALQTKHPTLPSWQNAPKAITDFAHYDILRMEPFAHVRLRQGQMFLKDTMDAHGDECRQNAMCLFPRMRTSDPLSFAEFIEPWFDSIKPDTKTFPKTAHVNVTVTCAALFSEAAQQKNNHNPPASNTIKHNETNNIGVSTIPVYRW